jgi:hypothetical protein
LMDLYTMNSMVNNPVFGDIPWIIMLLITRYGQHVVFLFEKEKVIEYELSITPSK